MSAFKLPANEPQDHSIVRSKFLRNKAGKRINVIIGDKSIPKGRHYGKPRANTRIAELNRELTDRYRGCEVLPDDDAGRDDVAIMLNHLALANSPGSRIANWLAWRAPWFDDEDMVDGIMAKPRTFTADQLAKRIGLTYARRTALAMTTIGAIDMPKKKRQKLRGAKKVARQRERRRSAGVKARAAYEEQSISRQKPWEALGMPRSTYYRHIKAEAAKAAERSRNPNVIPFETSLKASNSYISMLGIKPVSLTMPPAGSILTLCSSG